MKNFWQKNKNKIIKISLMLLMFIVVSIISMLILMACGVIYINDGLKLNVELFNSFKNSLSGWALLILLQIALTSLLCFIPGISMAFIIFVQTIFENPWSAFLLAFIGVLLSSMMMYIVGRFGGYKLCQKILGDKDCEKASKLLNEKCNIYFPLMMMFPIFPDDALVMIAGTIKMKLKWFIPSIVFGRGIGIATIVFGLGSIPYEKFTSPWHWILFIGICAILIFGIFFAAYRFNKYLEKRSHKAETEEKLEA